MKLLWSSEITMQKMSPFSDVIKAQNILEICKWRTTKTNDYSFLAELSNPLGLQKQNANFWHTLFLSSSFIFFFLFSKFSEIEKAEASEAYDNLYNICLDYIFWSTLAKPGQKHIFSEGVKLWVKWKNLDQYKMNVWFGLFILFFFSF